MTVVIISMYQKMHLFFLEFPLLRSAGGAEGGGGENQKKWREKKKEKKNDCNFLWGADWKTKEGKKVR